MVNPLFATAVPAAAVVVLTAVVIAPRYRNPKRVVRAGLLMALFVVAAAFGVVSIDEMGSGETDTDTAQEG